jgi:nitrogen PTS system EIIA component
VTKIQDILTPHHVLIDCRINSKRRTLELLSKLIAEQFDNLDAQDVFAAFVAREKLGSTVITQGVAVPHARLPQATKTVGAFLRLHDPIPYDDHDDHQVDMIFALIMPKQSNQQEHNSILSCLAGCFCYEERIKKLRAAKLPQDAFDALTYCCPSGIDVQ